MPKVDARTVAEHRRLLIDRVYRSFEALVFERGYDALNLADIAQAANLGRTTMYHYFPDKEALLVAYTSHEMDEFFSSLRADLHAIDEPVEQLDHYVRAQLTYFATHHLPPGPGLRSVLSTRAYDAIRVHAELLEVTLGAILAEATADGVMDAAGTDETTTIRLVLGALASVPVRDLDPAGLEVAIVTTQAFVRRAVGAVS